MRATAAPRVNGREGAIARAQRARRLRGSTTHAYGRSRRDGVLESSMLAYDLVGNRLFIDETSIGADDAVEELVESLLRIARRWT